MMWARYIIKILAPYADIPTPTFRYSAENKNKHYPGKKYFRADLGIEFKSSMEANYARYLTYIWGSRIKWRYEPKIFYYPAAYSLEAKTNFTNSDLRNPLNIKAYVPDFEIRLGTHIWFVECKGFMDVHSAEKIRLFRRYYERINLHVVDWDDYLLIKQNYSHLIKNWE